MSKFTTALLPLLLTAAAAAQAPNGYVVTAETFSGRGDGLVFVDPRTKVADRVTWPGNFNGTHPMVAVDDQNPHLYSHAGAGIGGAPIVQYVMQGNRIQGTGPVTGQKPFGSVQRMHVFAAGNRLLFTINSVNPGLWSRNLTGRTDKQEATITDAFEVTTIGKLVYVSTYKTGTPSKVFVVDILNGRKPVEIKLNLGNLKIAPFRGIDADPVTKQLIVGDDNGDLFRINPTNGAVAKINTAKGKGAVVALAAEVAKIAYVATKNAVYDGRSWFSATSKAFYTTTETINDIAYSRWSKGGVIHFGKGCAGSKGTPTMLFGGYPTQGNKTFSVKMQGGPANAGALLILGFNRLTWGATPLPWQIPGAPGCNLQVSPDIILPTVLDGAGALNLQTGVPVSNAVRGLHVMVQFGVTDNTNAAKLTASDALELVGR